MSKLKAINRKKKLNTVQTIQSYLTMAATMLAAIPMIILSLCMNKMFVAGITRGAVKG